jgi:uncharacterized membrane protein YoaT (DUF817 family)
MIAGAQTLAQSDAVSAALFVIVALVLVVFGTKVLLYASANPDALLPLRVSLGGLSLFSSLGLAYEATALLTGRFPTISQLTDEAFNTHPVIWVAIFLAVMVLIGLFTIHFTRVTSETSPLFAIASAFARHAILWVAAFGGIMLIVTEAVILLSPAMNKPDAAHPTLSWWVLLVGGAAYAVGGLIGAVALRPG